MKRIKINKKTRTYIIMFLILLQIVSAILIYREEYLVSDTIDKETILAEYDQKSNFDYIVNLKPNKLFDESNLINSNQTYFTKIVDRIDTTFKYNFATKSGEGIEIKGNYVVTAILSSELWEKRFVIIPKKEFAGKDKVEFVESFPINVSKYNDIATGIFNDIGMLPKDTQMQLIYDINAKVSKDGKDNVESFSPIITITSTKGAFNIEGDLTKNGDNNFKTIESMPNFNVLSMRLYLRTIFITLLISTIIIFFAFGNKEEIDVDRKDIEIINIKKKYGDLIVDAIRNDFLPDIHTIVLGSIEDLAKVAIEIERPIIHKDKYIYYVYDGSTKYEYIIEKENTKNN